MKAHKEVEMPRVIPFDTLAYAKKLEARGVEIKHAEAHAEVLAEVLENSFSTKQDTSTVVIGLSQEISLLRKDMGAEFAAVRNEMATEFAAVRNEMATEFAAVRNEMKTEFMAVRSEMTIGFYQQKWEILRWVLGIAFTQTALMFSMLKLMH